MSQVLHIFRKDTRQHWPEIALSIGLQFGYAWASRAQWAIYQSIRERQPRLTLMVTLGTLMVVGWWLLITRVVLDEPLVGDRQFWLTRPYEWKRLLAAKALFFACWIGVTYLLAQIVQLADAGFHPLQYLPGIAGELSIACAIFLLPVFALVVTSSTFSRMTLTLLGALVPFWALVAWLDIPRGYTPSVPYHDVYLLPVILIGCVVAIAVQYRTRRTWWVRGTIIAVAVVAFLIAHSYQSQGLVDKAYPQGSRSPLTVSYTPSAKFPPKARAYEDKDYLDLPIGYSGAPDGYAAFADNFRFTITSASGNQWTSPWQTLSDRMMPGRRGTILSPMISPAVFDRFKNGPVTLRIEFAVSLYRAEDTAKLAFPMHESSVPGLGICARTRIPGFPPLLCRSALYEPPLTRVTATETDLACDEASGADAATAKTVDVAAWIEPGGNDFGLTSVWSRNIFFMPYPQSAEFERAGGPGRWYLCPGGPMTFTPYHLVNRGRTSLTIANFQFPQLWQS